MSDDNGIVVYCSNGNVMFTSSGELIQNVKKVRKYKNMGNILFPVFNDMLEFTDNEFWIKMLGKFSKNKFPKNFSYVNGILSFKSKTKKKQSTLKIDENNLEESFELMKEFLKERKILPYDEKLEITSSPERKNIEKWKDVSKNKLNYIYDYIGKLEEKYNLTKDEKQLFFSVIRIGLAGDIFNDDTIHIEDNCIKDIDYLEWDEKKREFYIRKDFFNPKKYKLCKKDTVINTYSSSSCKSAKKSRENINYSKVSTEIKWKKFLNEFYKI